MEEVILNSLIPTALYVVYLGISTGLPATTSTPFMNSTPMTTATFRRPANLPATVGTFPTMHKVQVNRGGKARNKADPFSGVWSSILLHEHWRILLLL